jgi:hypothetical protein
MAVARLPVVEERDHMLANLFLATPPLHFHLNNQAIYPVVCPRPTLRHQKDHCCTTRSTAAEYIIRRAVQADGTKAIGMHSRSSDCRRLVQENPLQGGLLLILRLCEEVEIRVRTHKRRLGGGVIGWSCMLECEVEVVYFSNMKTVYLVHGRARWTR